MANQNKPERKQRTRKAGGGIPQGSVYVGRPSQWGNPAKVGEWFKVEEQTNEVKDARVAVHLFYQHCISQAKRNRQAFAEWLYPLLGRDVCCWCALGEPCHADVLLYFVSLLEVREGGALFFVPPKIWPPLAEVVKCNF